MNEHVKKKATVAYPFAYNLKESLKPFFNSILLNGLIFLILFLFPFHFLCIFLRGNKFYKKKKKIIDFYKRFYEFFFILLNRLAIFLNLLLYLLIEDEEKMII